MSAEDIRKLLLTTKLKKIKELELAIIAALKKPIDLQQKAQKVTYFQQLATTIINNLEVSIKNIHIRYEDSYTIPGTCISTGVTLYSISLSTTDDNWNIKFINTNTNTNNKNSKLGTSSNHGNTTSHNISTESLLSGNIIHKLGLMENLSVYWETDSEQFDKPEIDFYDWEKLMQDFIFSVDNNMDLDTMGTKHTDYTKYLLHPYNRFTVKIIHRQNKNASGTSASNSSNTNNNVPTLDVTVENSTVPFQLDKLQYHQLLLLVKKFGELERLKQMALYRPDKRPLDGKKAVREWWHYAYKLVSGKDFSAANQVRSFSSVLLSYHRKVNNLYFLTLFNFRWL